MVRITGKHIVEYGWIKELIIFVTLFILFTLNDWTLITSWSNLWMGICYFMVLYVHGLVHRFWLLPVLLDKHEPFPYVLFSVLTVLLFGGILSLAKNYWLYPECYLHKSSTPATYMFNTATCAVSLIAIMAPFLLLRFYEHQKAQAASLICMKDMELRSLRTQLNPHFMFNTFNNLYGISLEEPERIPEMILEVSQLMRYQLDNTCKEWVPLMEELEFVENYISLEEERVRNRCEIRYEYTDEDAGEEALMIAPMILIPFIENAFKHGTNSLEMCFVHIFISLKGSKLLLQVKNSIPSKIDPTVVATGIGLPNIHQRLSLLYAGKHKLGTQLTDKTYEVNLALQLRP
jgi:two-component system LytT family sensor kinase